MQLDQFLGWRQEVAAAMDAGGPGDDASMELRIADQVEKVHRTLAGMMRGPSPAFSVEQPDGTMFEVADLRALLRLAILEPAHVLLGELARAMGEVNRIDMGWKKNSAPAPGGPTTTSRGPASIGPTGASDDGAGSTPMLDGTTDDGRTGLSSAEERPP